MKVVTLALVLLALAACGVTETGNPVDASVELRARTSDPALVEVQGPAGVLSVDTALLAIDRLRLVHAEVCDTPPETEVDVDGPLVRDAADPLPIEVELPSATYCRARLRLEPAPSGPAELVGHTLALSGVLPDGTPWLFRSTRDFDIDVRPPAPLPIDELGSTLQVAFDMAVLLDGIDLAGAVVGPDGIRIEPGANDALRAALEARLDNAFELLDAED
ncbi:MAG: hypothetical protein H6734_26220 [Alphaproteobacteria bacterium]|nr:hypothetical protein [Alphaproteobacteria bacterium]